MAPLEVSVSRHWAGRQPKFQGWNRARRRRTTAECRTAWLTHPLKVQIVRLQDRALTLLPDDRPQVEVDVGDELAPSPGSSSTTGPERSSSP
jgi:hypothetical protein